jgi:hypothetical protein
MFRMPPDTIERATEIVPTVFYALIGIALLAALLGATGPALFFLIVGSAIHVARVGLEAL